MISNGRKILNSHTKFLKLSRNVIAKEFEKVFVMILRGAEMFCKNLDPNNPGHHFGLSNNDLSELSQEDFDKLYSILFSYFTLELRGLYLPGSQTDRINLTKMIVGKDYLDYILQKIMNNNPDHLESELLEEIVPYSGFGKDVDNITADLVDKILSSPNVNSTLVIETLAKIKLLHVERTLILQHERKNNKSCFIATDIYGDLNDSNVVILRRFRDRHLKNRRSGQIFIKLYYKYSPQLINTNVYKFILRKPFSVFLTAIVKLIDNKSR